MMAELCGVDIRTVSILPISTETASCSMKQLSGISGYFKPEAAGRSGAESSTMPCK
jgi:hypothetical protein